jgi:AcrR family transcriptional regulator
MTEAIPTAAALVDAGRILFGRHGYDGTSVRSLTRLAGANLGAVTYHFGSKEALYSAVLASGLEPLAAGVSEIAGQPGQAMDRVEWVVRLCCDYLGENRDVPRLIMRHLAGGATLPEPAGTALERILSALAGVIEDGQSTGSIRPADPELLAISVLAEPVQRNLGWPGSQSEAGPGEADGADKPEVDEHTVQFVLAGLRAAPPERGRGRRR